MSQNIPLRVPSLLSFFFLLGLTLTVLSFVDLHWTHRVLVQAAAATARAESPAGADTATGAGAGAGAADDHRVAQLRQSIVNVRIAQCGQAAESVGTGFVVKAGYVATAAHLLGDQQTCGARMRLIDSRGKEHTVALEGVSRDDDLALLRISDTTLPPLAFADSSAYENPGQLVQLVTIGYPLELAGASSQDSAAISGEGTLSRFDHEHNVFVTSGLNLNPGNSGGPVFVHKTWQVLGLVRAKLARDMADGIGFVAPSRTVASFFRDKTGQELR